MEWTASASFPFRNRMTGIEWFLCWGPYAGITHFMDGNVSRGVLDTWAGLLVGIMRSLNMNQPSITLSHLI